MASSLRRQLIFYFVTFALVLAALFAVLTLLVFHRVEDHMIERRLSQMLAREPGEGAPESLSFVGPIASAPAPFAQRLASLEAGLYEWEDDGREAHALLSVDDRGERQVAIASFTESQLAEARLEKALLFAIFATSLAALLLARLLAGKIVSPIERLTERVATGPLSSVVPEELTQPSREDEIGTLGRTLQRVGEELAASAQRERRFLREASHELRTPITVIQGVLDLLRSSEAAEDAMTRQRLDRLDRGLKRMHTSVLSLLAMARAEHRLATGAPPPFQQQLEDLIEEARALADPDVEVRCQLTAGPRDELAGSMLIVALANLTRNAVEHATSGLVLVDVETHQARVSDQGPGLSPSLLEQIGSTGPKPDVGIGLATVERICRRFGWGLELRCPTEGGTVVTLDLSSPRPIDLM